MDRDSEEPHYSGDPCLHMVSQVQSASLRASGADLILHPSITFTRFPCPFCQASLMSALSTFQTLRSLLPRYFYLPIGHDLAKTPALPASGTCGLQASEDQSWRCPQPRGHKEQEARQLAPHSGAKPTVPERCMACLSHQVSRERAAGTVVCSSHRIGHYKLFFSPVMWL